MAHSLSARKRVRQNRKRQLINRTRRGRVSAGIKSFMQAIDSNDPEAAEQKYRQVVKRLDQVSASGTIHKRTAARKKSRLARRLNNLKAQNA